MFPIDPLPNFGENKNLGKNLIDKDKDKDKECFISIRDIPGTWMPGIYNSDALDKKKPKYLLLLAQSISASF